MSEVMPDIEVEFDDSYNPMIMSPNCPYGLQFYQTPESMADVETYKKFLTNVKKRFRGSKFYKQYKDYIMNEIGLNMDQTMPNIDESCATLEMHHNFLTLFDICLLITEHTLKTTGYVSTFDIVQLLKEEHRNNHVPIVILSKTSHQIIENDDEVVLPAQMCFGDWAALLSKYNKGITRNLYRKIMHFIQVSIEADNSVETKLIYNLLEFRDELEDWSRYNDYGDNLRISGISYSNNYIDYRSN